MKKFLMCLALVGVMVGAVACTEEEVQKATEASFKCAAKMLPAAQKCVNDCLPTAETPEAKLECEKTCVNEIVGDAGATCAKEFGTEFKSEQFGDAVAALVKAAVQIYDAIRLATTNAAACPPCPCAVPATEEAPATDATVPVAPATEVATATAPTNAVLPVETAKK